MNHQEIMAQFESLGANCEFGIAQRMAGIEPFGLFRFAATPAELLIRLLRDRFAGLGDDLEMWNRDGEWMTKDRTYGWSMHTWTGVKEISYDTIVAREAKRLAYLRDRMLDLLAEASRTFVIVGCDAAAADTTFSLLRTYGPNRLLYVTEGDAGPRTIRPGMTHATVPRHAHPAIVDKDTDGPSWLSLCDEVLHRQYAGM